MHITDCFILFVFLFRLELLTRLGSDANVAGLSAEARSQAVLSCCTLDIMSQEADSSIRLQVTHDNLESAGFQRAS